MDWRPGSTTKFVIEVKNNPQKHCGKPTDTYPTNYDPLYVAIISGGFDLRSERNLDKEWNCATQLLQYIPPTENNGFAQLYAYDPKHTSHKSDDNRKHCNARGWITRDTFLLHMQRTTLKVRMSTGKVLCDSAQVLPCALEELGCETTSLDPHAYIWDYPDNCVLSVLRTEDVNMVKQGKKYYTISGTNSTTKFVFEVKNNPPKHCGKPTDIYPTNYGSLYVAIISGGFDLRSGRNLGKERNGATQLLQYIPPSENNGFAQLYAYDPKHISHKTSDEVMYLNMDYEMHKGTKLFFFFLLPLLPELTITSSFWDTTLKKINVSKNEHKPLLFCCYLLKTHASQDICWPETGQCFWKLMAA